jgi:hypothetical protein
MYYGPNYAAPVEKTIDFVGIPQQAASNSNNPETRYYSSAGKRFWNGYLVDAHHTYQFPHYGVMMLGNPSLVLSARGAWQHAFLCRFAQRDMAVRKPTMWATGRSNNDGMNRVQAYRWMQWLTMWKIGTTHPFGISRATCLAEGKRDLEWFYDNVVNVSNTNPTNPAWTALRNLGVFVEARGNSAAGFELYSDTDLVYYLGGWLLSLKTFGMWTLIRSQSTKCSQAIDWLIQTLAKRAVDIFLDTNGRGWDTQESGVLTVSKATTFAGLQVPASWAAWDSANPAINVTENWLFEKDGVPKQPLPGVFLAAQFVVMIADWFPEMNTPRIALAKTKVINDYDARKSYVDSQEGIYSQTSNDLTNQCVQSWLLKTPAEVGFDLSV